MTTRKILVAYASKSGSTREVAETIAEELRLSEFDVTVHDAEELQDLSGYDAAVIGSALYSFRWRPAAINLLKGQVKSGGKMPLWLFQTGPLEKVADGSGVGTPGKVHRLASAAGAAPPTTFGGRIEPGTAQGFMARKMATGPKAGDYRDFPQIRRWADGIAAQLAIPTRR
ncbi:menaquinone-dependent protoporphyrinogen oxidase [Nakamurella sp. UYEF19]|uniref:flavodoxin domain-containing protein n=1 Tax=Nakamurella sp. UYEF19 TaxID=1756392 RepID=UPI00339AD0BD